MTTKEIKEMVAVYSELPRTNKFKRAVDLALAQDLPLKINVAPPFKCFSTVSQDGKKSRYKIKFKNTRTGEVTFAVRTSLRHCADNKTGHYRGGSYSASSFDVIDRMISERHPDFNKNEIVYTQVGEHFFEELKSSLGWSTIALGISRVCKKDFAHTSPCGKCCGSGYLPHYAHIDNGVCWDCCGSGFHLEVGQDAQKVA
jgi:hypothetical protein